MAQLQSTVVSGNTNITGIVSAGARKLSMGILELNSSVTPTQFRINTTIPYSSGNADFTVNIKGFRYGNAEMTSLSIGWHFYNSEFYNRTAICNGAWAPTITLARDANGYVVIHLAGPGYWPKMYVESVYSGNYNDAYSTGWTWTDADLSNCTAAQTVPYKALSTNITGSAGSTDFNNLTNKTGGTGTYQTSGDFRAPIFYDSANTSYYVDPNSTSRMVSMWLSTGGFSGNLYIGGDSPGGRLNINADQIWTATGSLYLQYSSSGWVYLNDGGGHTQSATSMRAPIFYDSQDTTYYLDPNSSSNINSITTVGRIYSNEWIQFSNFTGLYSPNNGAHFRPNSGSYGPWLVSGSRNGWSGIEFDSLSNGNVSMMVSTSSNVSGFHNNSYGWQMKWEGGTAYVFKNTYGGGTQATVLDSSNYTSYAPSLTGSGASGTWGINITGNAATVGSVSPSQIVYGDASARRGVWQITNWNQTNYPDVAFLSSENSSTNAPTSDYSYGLQYSFHRSGASYRTQIVTSLYSDLSIWVRNSRDSDAWTSWKVLLHSGNYNSYSPTLTGGGASGTWGINITGTAGSETLATVTGRGASTSSAVTLNNTLTVGGASVYTYMWNDGSGTYLEAVGNTTATRKIRIQGNNGSGSYAQWFVDAGNQQIYGEIGGYANLLFNTNAVYLRYNGSDKFWTGSDGTRTQGWSYYQDASAGMYWPSNGWHLLPFNSADFRIHSGSASESSIRMETSGTTRGYFYTNSSNEIGILNSSRSWGFRMNNSLNAFIHGQTLTINADNAAWSSIYMNDGDEGMREIHCNSNRIGFLNQSGNWGAWNDDNGNWGMSLNAYMAGNRFDIQGAEGQISFKDGDNVWTGYVGFTGNLGYLSFPGRNVKINSGYNGTITLETGVSGYNDGVVSIPYGRLIVNNNYIYSGSYIEAGSNMRAPIFYDSENTAYYGDFASTSNINAMQMAGTLSMYGGAYYGTITFGTNSYWRAGISQRDAGNAELRIWAKGGTSGSIYFATGYDGESSSATLPTDGMALKNNNLGLGSWGVSEFPSYKLHIKGTGYATNDFRAPIFYDSNDTGYYLDPNSLSNLRNITVNHTYGSSILENGHGLVINGNYTNGQYSHRFRKWDDGGGVPLYVQWTNATANSWSNLARFGILTGDSNYFRVFGDSRTDGHFTLTGNLYVPNNGLLVVNNEPDTWGARFRTTTSTTNLGANLKNIIWCGGGSTEGFAVKGIYLGAPTALEVRNDGIVWAASSFRAPIFYDSDNTTYYADFNNTGRSIYTAGYLQSDRLIMKGSSGGGQIYPTISYGGVSLYGGDQLTNGAYFTVTGIDYGSSPGAGSAEFVIRSTATSKFALFSYNGSTWTGRYGLFGSTGNVTIGDASTDIGYRLYVIGDIYATGNVIAYSDARVKTNIREIENPLARVLNTRGVMYDRTDNEEKDNVGFIAQELEKEFPELISTSTDGRKGVKYQNMVAVLIEAMKEQNKEIQKLKMLINGTTKHGDNKYQ